MVEIGAGGGSLARVDAMQQIRVGPESAGSEPGPACYGRGGNHPGVTDADLVLGKLDPGNFAGGAIRLHPGLAASALEKHVGRKLQMDTVEAAFGVTEVVDENMANAARVHAVENGEDIGDYAMIAFGGAAPLHAGRLCEKLGIRSFIVPPGAGVGSAIGFLRAPFSFEANRSIYMKLSEFDAWRARKLFEELREEATSFVRSCDESSAILSTFKAYMRYTGQGWEIPVVLTGKQAMNPDDGTFRARFEDDYTRLFGRTVAGLDIEITVWSVNASTPPEPVEEIETAPEERPAKTDGDRMLFDPVSASFINAAIVHRETLTTGQQAEGPAAVTEAETTTVVPSGSVAVCQPDGCIVVSRKG